MELEFSRLNLKENDSLVIKVDTKNLSEQDAVKKLKEISEDPFIEFIKNKGHKVFVSYTGIDISVLRLQENEKVLVKINTDGMSIEEAKKYYDYIEWKMKTVLGDDKVLCVPVQKNLIDISVLKENNND